MLEDFVDKLVKRVQVRVPCLVVKPTGAASLQQSICDLVMKTSTEEIGRLLTSQFGFTAEMLEVVAQEYQRLRDREPMDEKLKARLHDCFSHLDTSMDPCVMIAGIEDSDTRPIEAAVHTLPPQDAAITRAQSSSPGEFRSYRQRKANMQCQLPGLFHSKSYKQVKKEFFRCQYIRSIKKAIRQMKKDKFPKICIHRVDRTNTSQLQQWESLKADFRHRSTALLSVSGSNLQTLENPRPESRSFNDAYCFSFFSEDVRLFHFKYCDFVYQRSVPELCANTKLRCCKAESHSGDCEKVWRNVRCFAKFGMLIALGFNKERLEQEAGDKADGENSVDS